MPFILRRSGPDFQRNGATVSPRALIGICEECGVEGAPFGFTDFATGTKTAWCGRRPDGTGYCKRAEAWDLFGAAA